MTNLEQEVLLARTRNVGTGAAKALRRAGQTPAVLYGKGIDSVPIAIDSKQMRKIMSQSLGYIHKIMVEDTGLEGNAMVQAIDRDPITGEVIHIDLHRISLTDKIKVEVPVTVIGEDNLTKQGLVLQRQIRDISVECLPGDIPTEFEIDVSHLDFGDTILAGDLKMPASVKIMTPPDEVVLVIVAPRTVIEEEVEEVAEEEVEEEGKVAGVHEPEE